MLESIGQEVCLDEIKYNFKENSETEDLKNLKK